jgi:hypothetical protein
MASLKYLDLTLAENARSHGSSPSTGQSAVVNQSDDQQGELQVYWLKFQECLACLFAPGFDCL